MVQVAPRQAGADASPWLAAMQSLRQVPDEAIGLMLDLPFCAWRCLYCLKDVESGWHPASMQAYVDALVRQIEQVSAHVDGQQPVALVDFGGGSPNHLQMPLLARLSDTLRRCFPAATEAEWSIACDPRRGSAAQMAELRALGFQHLRLGQADPDAGVQAVAGRVQSQRLMADVIGLARAARMRSVQLDVVCGLAGQNEEGWAASLQSLVDLGAERIRVLCAEQVSPGCGNAVIDGPDPAVLERLRRRTLHTLAGAGYRRIGEDLFVLDDDPLAQAQDEGRLARCGLHFAERPVPHALAFGPGNCSEVRGVRARSIGLREAWRAALEAGDWALDDVAAIDPLERDRRAAADALLCRGRLPSALLQALPAAVQARLAEDAGRGWLQAQADGWALTPEGACHLRALVAHCEGPPAPGAVTPCAC
jgi:oxygen-independent coproporphyrinogen-3 oxidase